ncbi:MAG: hypothetical protein ACM3UY_00120 [Methanocella sp.]
MSQQTPQQIIRPIQTIEASRPAASRNPNPASNRRHGVRQTTKPTNTTI